MDTGPEMVGDIVTRASCRRDASVHFGGDSVLMPLPILGLEALHPRIEPPDADVEARLCELMREHPHLAPRVQRLLRDHDQLRNSYDRLQERELALTYDAINVDLGVGD